MKRFLSHLPLNLKIKEIPELDWINFNGKPDENSQYDACLKWGIYYDYRINSSSGILDFNVQIKIEEGSWYKKGKETKDLLKHERGHYVIASIYGNHFKNIIMTKNFTKKNLYVNVEKEFYHEFNEIFNQCLEIQALYDNETNHSLVIESQKKWNEILCI